MVTGHRVPVKFSVGQDYIDIVRSLHIFRQNYIDGIPNNWVNDKDDSVVAVFTNIAFPQMELHPGKYYKFEGIHENDINFEGLGIMLCEQLPRFFKPVDPKTQSDEVEFLYPSPACLNDDDKVPVGDAKISGDLYPLVADMQKIIMEHDEKINSIEKSLVEISQMVETTFNAMSVKMDKVIASQNLNGKDISAPTPPAPEKPAEVIQEKKQEEIPAAAKSAANNTAVKGRKKSPAVQLTV